MQYNKVEISGVNTSKLNVLSEEKKTELLKRPEPETRRRVKS